MHIPNGFLDPKISAGLIGVAVAALSYSFAKVREMVTALAPVEALATAGRAVGSMVGRVRRVLTGEGERMVYKMGMVAALVFAGQMFNFPVSQGTSGHLIGGIFAAVILGPFAGAIVMAAVLSVQAFFFADGGLLALGANIVNMAVIAALGCYYLYFWLKRALPEWLAIFIAAWASVILASFACALQLGYSGTVPFETVIPAMVNVHAVIGMAEALITLALVNIFRGMLKGEK
jgi:cobalt/nickel transport system permease protein